MTSKPAASEGKHLKGIERHGLDVSGFVPGNGVWLRFEFQILGDQRPD